MASIEYSEIFSRFYLRVQDYKLGSMAEDTAKEILMGYLKQVISKPFVRKLFSSITADDDIEEIEFTMREPQDDAADIDFVEEVMVTGMTVEWLYPTVQSTVNTSQLFSNSEQKLSRCNPIQLAALGNFAVYSFEYAGNPLEP